MNTKDVWIVTGASRGIGLSIAQRVIANGDCVALLARSDSVYDIAQKLGEDALGFQTDITDESAVVATVKKVAAHFGSITRLVNNAGLHRGGRLGKLELSDWQAVIRTNLDGAMLMSRACEGAMSAGSSITNIGAVVGFRGFPGDAAYAASKAGLAGLTQALAIEFVLSGRIVPGKTRRVCEGVPLVGQGSGGSEAGLLDAGNQWLAFPKSIAFSDLGLVDC